MKKLAMMAFVALASLSSGCLHQSHQDYMKTRARWDTWGLGVTTKHADEQVAGCVKVLQSVDKRRQELTAQINDTQLAADVREDLKVQRGLVFQQGQQAVAKLQQFNTRLENDIEKCKSGLKNSDLTEATDEIAFQRVREAEEKLVEVKARTKEIITAWERFMQGHSSLADLK